MTFTDRADMLPEMRGRHPGTRRMFAGIGCCGMLCVLVTGCGGIAGPGHNQSSPSPGLRVAAACTLVSSVDVSRAFHQQFSAGSKASANGEIDNECLIAGQHGLVAVQVVSGEKASGFYTSAQQKLTGSAPVSGVGDNALLAADGTAILAIKGQIAVFITALVSDETASELGNGCVLLAKLVFSKTS